jgi:uncharacterized RDD family membrane protein YckC
MNAGVIDPIEQALAADAPMHDVLDLVDAAIESATATGDSVTLDRIASLLDATASERSQEWSRLSIAAARARAAATRAAATVPAPSAISPTDAPAASVPTPLTATADEQLRYAGWWLRTAAYVIDSLVLGFAYTLLDATGASDSSFLVVVWLGIPVAYFAGMHAFHDGATIGKAVLGLAVRAADGSPVRLGRATGRATATFLLWIVVVGGLVDMVVGAADPRRQWVHDKIAGTIVIHGRS